MRLPLLNLHLLQQLSNLRPSLQRTPVEPVAPAAAPLRRPLTTQLCRREPHERSS